MTNYYHILEIREDASDAEIKAAFKKKALLYHPDKNQGDPQSEEMFKLVNAAHQVLSNPYERARYDLKLRFGHVEIDRPPPRAYRKYERPRYAPPKIDHKTNDLATLWAFGISLGIAVVVMVGMQAFNMYTAHQREMILGQRRLIFKQALDYHAIGQVASCLNLLETMGTFHEEEEDIEAFQEDLLHELLQKGTSEFYQQNYDEALANLSIYDEYALNKRLSFEMLFAETHMKAGNHDEAIRRFNKIIVTGNNTIENNLKVAYIYREGKKDFEQAMNYYDIASDMAINGYKAIYGEAYPLILNPRVIPPSHFEIFHGMAMTFYYQENYRRALSAIKWNILMWPQNPENYVLKGRIFEDQQKYEQACGQYDLAKKNGWKEPLKCP